MHMPSIRWISFAALLTLYVAMTTTASACTKECSKEFHPDAILVDGCFIRAKETSESEVEITILGLSTHQAEQAQGCGAAIGPWRSASIRSAEMIDEAGNPYPGFTFEPNPTTAESVACVIGDGASGFFGRTTEAIKADQPVALRLVTQLHAGNRLEDLLVDLELGFLALGSADATGSFDGEHLGIITTDVPGGNLRIIRSQIDSR